jgi:hypothetical protein
MKSEFYKGICALIAATALLIGCYALLQAVKIFS